MAVLETAQWWRNAFVRADGTGVLTSPPFRNRSRVFVAAYLAGYIVQSREQGKRYSYGLTITEETIDLIPTICELAPTSVSTVVNVVWEPQAYL